MLWQTQLKGEDLLTEEETLKAASPKGTAGADVNPEDMTRMSMMKKTKTILCMMKMMMKITTMKAKAPIGMMKTNMMRTKIGMMRIMMKMKIGKAPIMMKMKMSMTKMKTNTMKTKMKVEEAAVLAIAAEALQL
jgi:hypothetical protein